MMHGGGMTWGASTYDPELNLLYFGTGNPQPVIAGKGREGDNLYTESIVALNPDTGKMAWYFQVSPHDTHDWDANANARPDRWRNQRPEAQTDRAGQPQRLLLRARPRHRQEHRHHEIRQDRTGPKGSTPKASRSRIRPRCRRLDGALVSPNQGGAANWPPPSFSPDTGLFYVNATRAFSVYYIFDRDDKPEGWGGNDRGGWSRIHAAGDRLQNRQGQLEP